MYNNLNMKLNYKKIVDKKFESVINGYSPTQVDTYLDLICSDYILYDKKLLELEILLNTVNKENENFKQILLNQEKEVNTKKKNINLARTHEIDLKISK